MVIQHRLKLKKRLRICVRFNDTYSLLYLVKKLFYKLKNINMDEVNYKWVIGQGWVVESENGQLKLMVEETLKEVDRTINFQEYLDEYSK